MDQPAHEGPGVAVDDLALPWGEDDGALVLAPGTHLGEQVGPVPGTGVDVHASLGPVTADPRMHAGERQDRRSRALVDDPGIAAVQRDARLEAPSRVGNVPISEVRAEQVAVGRGISWMVHERMFPYSADGATRYER